MVVDVGFEPTARITTNNTLAGCRFKPLIQSTNVAVLANALANEQAKTASDLQECFYSIELMLLHDLEYKVHIAILIRLALDFCCPYSYCKAYNS